MSGLLFDENLSEAVVNTIGDLFPRSVHLRALGLGGAPDAVVWETAKKLGLILITRDYDFQTMSVMRGHPPKVIHLDAFTPFQRRCHPGSAQTCHGYRTLRG